MKKTPIFIFIFILAITIFDTYVIFADGKDESISSYIIRWSFDYPMFTLGMGIVIGHLFWSFDVKKLYVEKFKNKDKK